MDGLLKRVETPLSMTEYFLDRPDFLHYRHVDFGKREKKFGPAESAIPRPIEVRRPAPELSMKRPCVHDF